MWAVDQKGGLVNLDNAVWVGITTPRGDEHTKPAFEALLTAHMVDGTSITLEAGTEAIVRARLNTLAALSPPVPHLSAADRVKIGSRMRHED